MAGHMGDRLRLRGVQETSIVVIMHTRIGAKKLATWLSFSQEGSVNFSVPGLISKKCEEKDPSSRIRLQTNDSRGCDLVSHLATVFRSNQTECRRRCGSRESLYSTSQRCWRPRGLAAASETMELRRPQISLWILDQRDE